MRVQRMKRCRGLGSAGERASSVGDHNIPSSQTNSSLNNQILIPKCPTSLFWLGRRAAQGESIESRT